METKSIWKFSIKNSICYYFDDINKFENLNFDSILIDKKLHKNILIYHIPYKTLIGAKP